MTLYNFNNFFDLKVLVTHSTGSYAPIKRSDGNGYEEYAGCPILQNLNKPHNYAIYIKNGDNEFDIYLFDKKNKIRYEDLKYLNMISNRIPLEILLQFDLLFVLKEYCILKKMEK